VLAALLGYDVRPTSPAEGLSLPVFLVVLTVALPLLAPVYWGEEFGWTGYLRQRLFPGQPLRSAIVTGLIWAVWHYPLAFLGYVTYANIAIGLLTWTVVLVLQEIVLTWLYIRSGSIWTASLAHAGNNMVIFLLVAATVTADGGPLDSSVTDLLVAAPMALLCAGIVLRNGLRADGERRSGSAS
jgi:membrane protease YdiL (CAAX protease family)